MADSKKSSKSATDAPAPVDRVVMASRKPDGTPDQTPGFRYIGDKDRVEADTAEQLRQQAHASIDEEARRSDSTLSASERDDKFEEAAEAAEKQAKAEVSERHVDNQ